MNSNTTIGAVSNGGVGLQVDLPGLASLFLKLSAAGLKRFAQAGVDVHTILCMGEIAETCPASTNYRRVLSVCREEQRKESQIFYKVVELGSASNFVADELLKRRAGENIVALMSTILPVISETSCDNLLLELFEATGASLDKTPGLGQLKSLRETLFPLARKLPFKDKMFQYHSLVRQLLQNGSKFNDLPIHLSIPSEKVAVQVVLALSSLAQDSTLVLIYRGLKGSSWVIAYARHVLELSVCILKSASSAVPVSGDFKNARVFVHIYDGGGNLEVLTRGEVRSFFATNSIDPSRHFGCCVDARATNILDCYLPAGYSKPAVATIMITMSLEVTKSLVGQLARPSREFPINLVTYYLRYYLRSIQNRAQHILRLFGCEPRHHATSRTATWSDYFLMHGSYPQKYCWPSHRSCYLKDCLQPGPEWNESGLGNLCTVLATDSHPQQILDNVSTQCISFLLKLVEAASWLALTTWHQNVGLLSTAFLERHFSWRESLLYNQSMATWSKYHHPQWLLNEIPTENLIVTLCGVVATVSIGGYRKWAPYFTDKDLLSVAHEGIIYTQNAALQEKFDIEGCLLHVTCGAIVANNESRKTIHSVAAVNEDSFTLVQSFPHLKQPLKPINLFPSIFISTLVEHSGEGLIVHRQALTDNRVACIMSLGDTTLALLNLMIPSPCRHDYYNDLRKVHWRNQHVQSPGYEVKQGFSLGYDDRGHHLWLQAVDQNTTGQWLAYQSHGYNILQRDSCLHCTLLAVRVLRSKHVMKDLDNEAVHLIFGKPEK